MVNKQIEEPISRQFHPSHWMVGSLLEEVPLGLQAEQ